MTDFASGGVPTRQIASPKTIDLYSEELFLDLAKQANEVGLLTTALPGQMAG
jgi:hypothetical protein